VPPLENSGMFDPYKSVLITGASIGQKARRCIFSRLLREPLVHFLLIGAAVFGFYGLVAPPAVPAGSEIVITAADAGRLKAQFRATWNRDPTTTEFNGLLDNLIREEVFYREAKLFGLDQNDQVIRLRLRQKTEYLISQPGALPPATETQLRAHYEATQAKYAVPSSVSFEQVFLGEPSQDKIARSVLKTGGDASALGTATLLPGKMPSSQQAGVDSTFGKGFFALVTAGPVGEWIGPIKSAYGQHMIRVTGLIRSEALPYEKVRELVERDWRSTEADKAKEAAYQAMKSRYRIDISQIDRPS
jgi:hypothetical protein